MAETLLCEFKRTGKGKFHNQLPQGFLRKTRQRGGTTVKGKSSGNGTEVNKMKPGNGIAFKPLATFPSKIEMA